MIISEFCFSTPRIIMQRWRASIDHAHAAALDRVLDGVGDLLGQPLLDLQAAGVHVHQAGELAETPSTLPSAM